MGSSWEGCGRGIYVLTLNWYLHVGNIRRACGTGYILEGATTGVQRQATGEDRQGQLVVSGRESTTIVFVLFSSNQVDTDTENSSVSRHFDA